MREAPTVVWQNGTLVPYERACVPIEDRGLQFGESLYEVAPITNGRVRLLNEHAVRMRTGATVIGIEAGVPSDADWVVLTSALLERDAIAEGLLYAQVTGGAAPRRHIPMRSPEPNFFAYVRAVELPRAAAVQRGIRAITSRDPRRARVDVKTTMLLPAVQAKREAIARGANEVLFVGADDVVREGASSNVFVVEGRTVTTPTLTQHLLPGITRPLVGRLAAEAGLEFRETEVPLARLLAADELFITATTQLVMPVLAIDDRPIGTGQAGPIATDLAHRLRTLLELE